MDALQAKASGYLFYVRKRYRFDGRAPAVLGAGEGHWFWQTLKLSLPIYRDSLLALLDKLGFRTLPLASADGNSQIVGPNGKLLAQSLSGETFTAFGEIDIAHLRGLRRVPAMVNSLARQRPGLFGDAAQVIDASGGQSRALANSAAAISG